MTAVLNSCINFTQFWPQFDPLSLSYKSDFLSNLLAVNVQWLFTELSIRRIHFRWKNVSLLLWLNGWNTTRTGCYPPISTKYPKLSLSGSACAPANHVPVFLDPWRVDVLLTLCTPYSSSGSTVNAVYTIL